MIFTIVIPVYNRNSELSIALSSCRRQICDNFEVIVVDDCSSEPASIVTSCFPDLSVTYVRNQENLGAAESRNRGLAIARGDYAVFLDSDDVYLPEKLFRLSATIEKASPDVILHRQYRVHDARPDKFIFSTLPRKTLKEGESIEEFAFHDGNFYNINSIAVSRRVYSQTKFRKELRLYEDQAFVFDCARMSRKTVVLDDVLSVYVDDQRTERASRKFRSQNDFSSFLIYADKHMSERSVALVRAAAASEMSFWRNPTIVVSYIFGGQLAGVSLQRTFFYLFRSIFGARVGGSVRRWAISVSAKEPRPVWSDVLLDHEVQVVALQHDVDPV